MLKNVAITLPKLNRHEEAMEKCNHSLAIYEKVYGPDHPETVALAAMPGLLLTLAGD